MFFTFRVVWKFNCKMPEPIESLCASSDTMMASHGERLSLLPLINPIVESGDPNVMNLTSKSSTLKPLTY